MNLKTLRPLALAAAAFAWGGSAVAATQAPANSSISNTASVTFTVGTSTTSQDSNTETFTVDELIDVSVARQSAAQVTTLTPATAQSILFRVTNLGNGTEQFDLSGDVAVAGDDFDVSNLVFYVDDGDGIFEPGADDGAPVTFVSIGAELFEDVWFVADVPGSLNDGDTADITLTATANTGTGVAGSESAGAGDGGSDAVYGNSGGTDTDVGAYLVANITFSLVKTSSILDPFGGAQPIPGAVVTYTLTLTTAGTATATSVNIQDDIPTNTTYVASSITVNTVGKTDANDAEAAPTCDFNVTNAGGIYCLLGSLTGATVNTVTFQVTIN